MLCVHQRVKFKMTQHQGLSFTSTLLLLIVTIGIVKSSQQNNNNNITILRCCRDGEALDPAKSYTACRGVEETKWPPYIYSPANQQFQNDIPKAWSVVTSKPNCEFSAVISNPLLTPKFLMFDNGSLWVQDVKSLLDPQKYCVDERVALVCLANDELVDFQTSLVDEEKGSKRKKTRIINKCCGEGGAYSEENSACVHYANKNASEMIKNWTASISNNATVFTTGFPTCPKGKLGQHVNFVIAGSFDENEASIDTDGVLHLKKSDATYETSAYCLEHVYEHTVVRANIFTCPNIDTKNRTLPMNVIDRDLRFTLYPIGLVLSVFFLAATIAVGFVLPSSHQHMLHWRCQTGHVACLLVGDLVLAITQFTGDQIAGGLCEMMAITMHFFFLAAFFWLNTMCFNIWWTFRDMRPSTLDRGQETFRLRLYHLYAWGGAFAIAGVAALIDNLPENTGMSLLRPRFGHQRCWFYGDIEIFTYFYGPVGILLAINLILFALTARELTCGLWKREVAKTNVERTALGRVCLKLVVVMGLTWVIDVVSWAVGGPHYLWYLTDLINALQGVFIFIVVGCQPQIWAAINRLWCFKVNQRADNNVGNNMSSCSQGLPSMGDSTTNANSPQTKSVPTETEC